MSNLTDKDFLTQDQYKDAIKVQTRWKIYDFTEPKYDITRLAIESLKLSGNETLLEVGCGDGLTLIRLRKEFKHSGNLTGLDINNSIFSEGAQAAANEHLNINYLVGDASNLPFNDHSYGVILAMFMIYHLPDIDAALREWKRVLKPGGKILISTSGALNRPKLNHHKKILEDITHSKSNERLSEPFKLENGEDILKKHFVDVRKYTFISTIKITDPKPWLDGLNTLRKLFSPIPNEEGWQKGLEEVRKLIQADIDNIGFFSDTMERGFFIVKA